MCKERWGGNKSLFAFAQDCREASQFSRGVRMYTWNTALSHLPNILMVESLMPHSAAVVAAPMRNEWPANWDGLKLPARRASWILCMNHCCVNSQPSANWNRQLRVFPLKATYASSAVIGQVPVWVLPSTTSTPFWNGSVLEAFRTTCGLWMQSTDTSVKHKCAVLSNADSEGTVNSPALKKP